MYAIRSYYSGGSGSVLDPELREADDARILMHELGFDTSRVVFERVSRNTWENAVMSREAVSPESGEVWVLVTSAAHMPRAVGCFRKAGFPVLPWPVDYATPGLALIRPRLSLLGGLANLNTAAHEWLGLVAYSLLGRTSELFPGPVRREIREHSLTVITSYSIHYTKLYELSRYHTHLKWQLYLTVSVNVP